MRRSESRTLLLGHKMHITFFFLRSLFGIFIIQQLSSVQARARASAHRNFLRVFGVFHLATMNALLSVEVKWIELFKQRLLNECKWKRDDSQI